MTGNMKLDNLPTDNQKVIVYVITPVPYDYSSTAIRSKRRKLITVPLSMS